jgi:hypothetical protein
MSFPIQPPNNVPMLNKQTGLVTEPWALFFTRVAGKLNAIELNFAYEAPNLVWKDPNGNNHTIASTT